MMLRMDNGYTQPQRLSPHTDGDDWPNAVTPTERRRRQNRINQRAFRQRQVAKRTGIVRPTQWKLIGSLADPDPTPATRDGMPVVRATNPGQYASKSSQWTCEYLCRLAPENARQRLAEFQAAAHRSYVTGSPTTDHLLTTVKLNVYRALVENMAALGMNLSWMAETAISPFCTSQPWPALSTLATIPTHLQPTVIQRSVPHHPWLDFFPHPGMRDRLICAGDFDDDELCVDIMAFWNSGKDDPGLIIWGQPWDLRQWELSEGFLRKWGWTVRGCPELLESTNYWRALRGEEPLPPGLYELDVSLAKCHGDSASTS
ncbi:hypothetical protein BJY01DRAFT_21050 [Aspergillus pseudoustus]|uniref:BZIP domain-containing protein n=1 Tax=Aspergillus pseudoustus TaxID=1810923 RepID=A0ABR4JJT5_9EURO